VNLHARSGVLSASPGRRRYARARRLVHHDPNMEKKSQVESMYHQREVVEEEVVKGGEDEKNISGVVIDANSL